MKKTFKLTQENKHPDRVLDSIKYDIRRYLKRERKKKLPEDAVFWEFDCKFGQDSDTANAINTSEITACLEKAKIDGWEKVYLEILAKPSQKSKKDTKTDHEDDK